MAMAVAGTPMPIMTKNAGPSAVSANDKLRPQTLQLFASLRKPLNILPLPQRGQADRTAQDMIH
jgi:hypothetical protein